MEDLLRRYFQFLPRTDDSHDMRDAFGARIEVKCGSLHWAAQNKTGYWMVQFKGIQPEKHDRLLLVIPTVDTHGEYVHVWEWEGEETLQGSQIFRGPEHEKDPAKAFSSIATKMETRGATKHIILKIQ